ncbi:MAG: CotH kinase family protein [Cytophagaceae bacterium]|nr:CotH kinase family protein [Cytophagaceae bacterium]
MKIIAFLFALFLFAASNLNGQSQSTAGDDLFNADIIYTIDINFSQANYWTQLQNNKSFDDANDTSTYIPATVIINGISLDSVGIQFKGNSSYYNYPSNKKPFTLSFNEYLPGQEYDNLKSINLNNLYQDPTFMREKLFLDFLNEKGLYAPRANYARLYINGSYWGLYLMVERVNKTFLKDRFILNTGNLFKGDRGTSACAYLTYYTGMTNYYNCYELKTNETANDWSDLIDLTYQINNTTNAQFRDSVEAVMNTNSFIGAWAAYNLFIDFDSYPYRFVHNYYLYHNPITNKFEWIVWDASTAFGLDVPGTISQIENTSVLYLESPQSNRPLCQRMLADNIYKDSYLKYVCSFANNDFLPSVLNPKIDSLYNRIKFYVYADAMKMYSNTDFDNNINAPNGSIPGLKSFIANRSTSVLNELASLGYTGCPQIIAGISKNNSSDIQNITIFPNPSANEITINLESPKQFEAALYNALGELLIKVMDQKQINISGLPSGIYYLNIKQGDNFYSQKIIRE